MIHFVVAFGLLLHVLFWGAGLAMLVMPRPWRRFWPVLILPAGFALQSAVVWLGASVGWHGTQAYAAWSEWVPVLLAAVALWRAARRGGAGWRPAVHAAWTDVSRFGLIWAAVAGCLMLLALPVAVASRGLTTLSLGSCDAADYAAGARVLLEFARADRSGFLGLTEVVRVHSVDNFFDYWLRLNHFTPSALIAFNGAVLGCAPHEITTLMAAVLLAGMLPVVFWSARAIFGYSGGVSVIITGLFGISPIGWYAVAHVAAGQLLAAQAIVLLTWPGIALWRGRLTWRRGLQFAAVLAIAYWLLLGSYNFFLLVCFVPALAFAGGLSVWQRRWRKLARWLGCLLAPLVVCGAVFAERVRGLAERFTLLQTYDFGWRIPALTPEGWLGMVRGGDLRAWDVLGLRWILAAGATTLLLWSLARAVRERRRAVWLVLATALPVLAGYGYLELRGIRLGTNASYDAYKLFAVFYPLLLPAFCWWVTLRRSRRLFEWFFVVAVAAVVIGSNLIACGMFIWKMSRPPLLVDGQHRQLRKVDAMPDVASVNLLVPDMWSRLWANAFLLHKAQFFLTHTYEGRLNTPLRGEWDLEGGLISLHPAASGARRQITPRFALVDTRAAGYVRALAGTGWYDLEFIPGAPQQWRWTQREATIDVENPHGGPLQIRVTLEARSVKPREVTIGIAGREVTVRPVHLGVERARHTFPPFELPPGKSTLVLRSPQSAEPAGAGDTREVSMCVFNVAIEVLE